MRILLIIGCVMSVVWLMSTMVAFGGGLLWMLDIFLVAPIAQEPPDFQNFGIWLLYTVISALAPFVIVPAFLGCLILLIFGSFRERGDGRIPAQGEAGSHGKNRWAMRYPLFAIAVLTVLWVLVLEGMGTPDEAAPAWRHFLSDAGYAFFQACPLIILGLLAYIVGFWLWQRVRGTSRTQTNE